ncbi:MAG: stage II sporulation protein R [Candidatus Spyradocola sp.]
MKRWIPLLLCLLICCTALYVAGVAHPTDLQRAVRSGDLLRIHILAHDDTDAQQNVKLCVRDAILAAFTPMLSDAQSAQEAARIVRDNLSLAQSVAEDAVRAQGCGYPVRVSFGAFDFPDRTYGGQLVPAGTYTALRIELGDAAGRNWWCVMYPPLCFSGEDVEQTGVRFESSLLKWIRSWKKEREHASKQA